ncbi:MAG: hypothetical protein MZV70_37645 [Desulfobacterales bacterium]|nr:hypothetical protein [Desulfobacterales bacterium]
MPRRFPNGILISDTTLRRCVAAEGQAQHPAGVSARVQQRVRPASRCYEADRLRRRGRRVQTGARSRLQRAAPSRLPSTESA